MMLLNPFRFGGGIPALWNDLAHYYNFDDNTTDQVGSSDGTLINGLTYTSGIINNGLDFDGVNDGLSLPTNFFKPSVDWTVCGWVNIQSHLNGEVHMGIGQGNFVNGMYLYSPSISGNYPLRLYLAGAVILSSAITTNLATDTWYFFAATHEFGVGYKLYINGVLEDSDSTSYEVVFPASSFSSIGVLKSGESTYSRFYEHMSDEWSFFDRELSASELLEIYNSGSGRQYPT
jgi:hypothetical protein